jgi:hypothetical protein
MRGKPMFRSLYLGLGVEKVELEQVFLRVFRFYSLNFIPTVIHHEEKPKKEKNWSSSSQGFTRSLKVVVRP